MFKWLKSLFGTATVTSTGAPVVEEVQVKEPAKPKKQAKKPAAKPKKTTKVDLDGMNKTQLLAEAKKRGIKANASLKKGEILEAIKNG